MFERKPVTQRACGVKIGIGWDMTPTSGQRRVVRFGVFEADLQAGELRKNSLRIRLQEQPFRILAALLERPGEIVTREELIRRLWPNGTVVEYEHSLGTAVNKIRQALGDTADNPRFVETHPRRGYRFLLSVERIARPADERPQPVAASQPHQPGGTISRYRIIEKIGEGGMGVVYKAEDTKLERPVALKFLAAHALEEPAHRSRLIREAKAAARLDHPNICPVYEIDEVDGQLFLAMAYLEGRTVKDKIAERPLKLSEALDIAIQTAQGLQAAHKKGIVHRDIKSANLMLLPEGRVKIMDFGLAQLADRSRLTQAAALLGTPAYMSPEQAQRQPTDRRTDIWSLGVVLYEMVTGRVPFESDRETAALHAIIHDDHEPITALRAGVPLQLDTIVGKALAKDPQERYQDVDDLLVDLRALRKDLGASKSTARQTSPTLSDASPRWKPAVPYVAVAFAASILSVVAMLVIQRALEKPESSTREAPSDRFSFDLPDLQFAAIGDALVEISPNGRAVAYVGESGFWIRDLSEQHPRRLEGTEGAGRFAWSPDSKNIAFRTKGAIKRVSAAGGPPVTFWEHPSILPSGSVWWDRDGRFVRTIVSGTTYEVSAGGGLPRESPIRHDPVRWGPPRSVLTTDSDFLYVKGLYPHQREIMLAGLQTEESRFLTKGWAPWYSSGHILFASLGPPRGIWAMPFSAETRRAGEPFVVEPVNAVSLSVANDGTLVYTVNPLDEGRLLLLNRKGDLVKYIGQAQGAMGRPDFSPDGRRVAVWGFEYATGWDVWLHEVDRPLKTLFTRNDGMDMQPVWSPDGARIAFTTDREGDREGRKGDRAARDLYAKSVDRNEAPDRLTAGPTFAMDWSADGAYLLVTLPQDESQQGGDLGYLDLTGEGPYEIKPLRTTRYVERHAVFSPDGRYVAFVSDYTGQLEVYVCSFPECLEEKRVSVNGGRFPRWAKKQGSLYFVQGADTLMEAKITTQPELDVETPRRLFAHPSLHRPGVRATWHCDVSDDGEHFVLVERGSDRINKENPAVVYVWRNWHAKFRDQWQEWAAR